MVEEALVEEVEESRKVRVQLGGCGTKWSGCGGRAGFVGLCLALCLLPTAGAAQPRLGSEGLRQLQALRAEKAVLSVAKARPASPPPL